MKLFIYRPNLSTCSCSVSCVIKAGINSLSVFELRSALHIYSAHGGSLRRQVAGNIKTTRALAAAPKINLGGGKRKRQSLTLNNVDVCSATYLTVLDVTENLLKNARADAASEQKVLCVRETPEVMRAEALNGSVERLNAVAWIIIWADISGAELLPFGADLASATAFQRSLPGGRESADNLSIIRLLESSGAELYKHYIKKSEGGLVISYISSTAFMDIF